VSLDFSDCIDEQNKNQIYLVYSFAAADKAKANSQTLTSFCTGQSSGGTVLFVLPKDFAFEHSTVSITVEESDAAYIVTVSSDKFAKGVALDLREGDAVFSDNWFDLTEGTKREIIADKTDVTGVESIETFRKNLYVTTLNDVLRDNQDGKYNRS
jgi:beta-mannosidase